MADPKKGIARAKHVIKPSIVSGYDNNQTPRLEITKNKVLANNTEPMCTFLTQRPKNVIKKNDRYTKIEMV